MAKEANKARTEKARAAKAANRAAAKAAEQAPSSTADENESGLNFAPAPTDAKPANPYSQGPGAAEIYVPLPAPKQSAPAPSYDQVMAMLEPGLRAAEAGGFVALVDRGGAESVPPLWAATSQALLGGGFRPQAQHFEILPLSPPSLPFRRGLGIDGLGLDGQRGTTSICRTDFSNDSEPIAVKYRCKPPFSAAPIPLTPAGPPSH